MHALCVPYKILFVLKCIESSYLFHQSSRLAAEKCAAHKMLEAKKKVEKQGQNAKNTPVIGMIFPFPVFHDRKFIHCPTLSVLSQIYDFGVYQKKMK